MASKSIAVAVLSCLIASTAGADPRPKRPAGTVALTTAALSGRGPALLQMVRKASAAPAVFSDNDGWRVFYALAVPHALPSSEITIKVSDVSQPKQPKQPLCTRHKVIYSDAEVTRGQLLLTRDEVSSPNAKLLLEIESDGELIARQTFFIKGKAAASPASIDFSAEEAVADDDDGGQVANRRK